jgi:hypothetical protein
VILLDTILHGAINPALALLPPSLDAEHRPLTMWHPGAIRNRIINYA